MSIDEKLVDRIVQRRLAQDNAYRYAENPQLQSEREAVVTAEVELEVVGIRADPTTTRILVGRIVRGEVSAEELAADWKEARMPEPITDHFAAAEDALRRADDWANRDNVTSDDRARLVGHWLARAQIHATLAVSQGLAEVGVVQVSA
jgi:hypothetical protein